MSDAERKLAELFAAELPPARDTAFTFAVLERLERRRAWLNVLDSIPFFLAAGVLLWALAPTLDALVQDTLALLSAPVFAASLVMLLTVLAFLIYRRGPWAPLP